MSKFEFGNVQGGASAVTADNGLNVNTPGNIELGGPLTKDTTISGAHNLEVTTESLEYSASNGTQSNATTFSPVDASSEISDTSNNSALVGVSIEAANTPLATLQVTGPSGILNSLSLQDDLVSSFYGQASIVPSVVNSATINTWSLIGSIKAAVSDSNGVEFSQVIAKVIISADARTGGSAFSNTAALEFDIRATFANANGTWQNFTPISRQAFGGTAYQISLQGFYRDVGDNTSYLQLRLINLSGMASFGWKVSVYVLRPQKTTFVIQTGTGVDGTGYSTFQSMICTDYLLNKLIVSRPMSPNFTAAGAGIQFNIPTTNGSANQVLITDGSGNASWANTPVPASGVTKVPQTPVTDSAVTSSQNITIYPVTASQMYRVNATVNYYAGTGTLLVTVSYTDSQGTARTLSFYNQGATVATLTGVQVSSFPPMCIWALTGHNITVDVTITGSVTGAQVGAAIETFQ